MTAKTIRQIILGKLEKAGLLVDEILISEIDELRDGFTSFFHVRKLHGGLYRSLGYWNIHVRTGKINGIAKDLKSARNRDLISFDQFRKSQLENVKSEERVLRQRYEPIVRIIEHFSAKHVNSTIQLLYPTNYIRKTLDSLVQKTIKHRIRFLNESINLPKDLANKFSEALSIPFKKEIEKTIRNLASFSARANLREEVSREDVYNASNFLKAFLSLALEKFSESKNDFFVMSDEEIEQLVLGKAFYQWRVFRRLPSTHWTTKNLILLLIENTCIHYALDKLPSNMEKFKEYIKGGQFEST